MLLKNKTIQISLVLFIEGFVSLAYQMLYIKQMAPFVGNSVEVVSWIIGVFLIALAIGYKVGGNPTENIEDKLIKNFIIAASIAGFFLSFQFLEAYFKALSSVLSPYYLMVIYCLVIVFPVTFLLGQTIPLMTNKLKGDSVSQISGNVLFLSTIGSFLGAIITTNIILKYLGVSYTILISSGLLFLLSLLISNKKLWISTVSLIIISSMFEFNVKFEENNYIATNQYASYEVLRYPENNSKIFKSNGSNSSILINGKKYGYIKLLDDILFQKMKIENKEILVIGAGGFVLSKNINNNKFTYVDIDPEIKDLAERYFLHESINGEFKAEDGRSFIKNTKNNYDIIVLDAFLSKKSIPEHLSTIEYIKEIKSKLRTDGVFVVNVIGRRDFTDIYTQSIHKTITTIFPYCFIQSSAYEHEETNIQYICMNSKDIGKIYTDDRNNSNSDFNKNVD